jgi:hypothetical protein
MIRRRPVLVAAALAVLAAGAVALSGEPSRPPVPRPSAGPPAPRAAVRSPTTARELLARPLGLAPAQRRSLERLAAAWDRESAPLNAAIAASRTDFEAFMAEASRARGARLADVRARAGDLGELSRELRARRAGHDSAALAVLTPEQRAALATPPISAGGPR